MYLYEEDQTYVRRNVVTIEKAETSDRPIAGRTTR